MRPRDLWMTRIKDVEREYKVVFQAMSSLENLARANPSLAEGASVATAKKNLPGTYCIRLFAEFETCLREVWTKIRATDPPRAVDLINGLSSTRKVPDEWKENAHKVRKYRNGLLHDLSSEYEIVSIEDARRFLCRYMSRLPPDW